RAIPKIYVDLFDRLCNREVVVSDDLSGFEPLDGAVYMIWDMGAICMPLIFRNEEPDLRTIGFQGLETILTECVTPACMASALHGLGHLQDYNREGVEAIVDRFLS